VANNGKHALAIAQIGSKLSAMRMRDYENLHGRRVRIALAWVAPSAVILSALLLPKLKAAIPLMNWIPRVIVIADWLDALLIWICFAIVSSGFLSVDFCRWRYRMSENTLGITVMALAFFCVQSILAYLVVYLVG
jgi:hypothetical protein